MKNQRKKTRYSRMVEMRDGNAIAIDVTLPGDLSPAQRIPCVIRPTRYHRAVSFRGPIEDLDFVRPWDLWGAARGRFVDAGYAWVDVDARGSGASRGTRPCPWSPEEVRDGRDLVDHLIREPWSNGKVGALGISYDGTAAEMLLINQHEAVRAAAPMFSLFDAFRDVAFPGGIHLAWFTEAWATYNSLLDKNRFDLAMSKVIGLIAQSNIAGTKLRPDLRDRLAFAGETLLPKALAPVIRALVSGVRRVDGVNLDDALADHTANANVHHFAVKMNHRDDGGLSPELGENGTIDLFSPHTYAKEIAASGAAIFSISGWFDGGYARAAIDRHALIQNPGSELLVGAWTHAGKLFQSPFAAPVAAHYDFTSDLIGFFDAHLSGAPRERAPVRYAVLGEGAEGTFTETTAFPLRGGANGGGERLARFALRAGQRLVSTHGEPGGDEGIEVYRIDPDLGAGYRSRWRGLLSLVAADIPDRGARDERCLTFDSEPLHRALDVVGVPRVSLVILPDATDAHVFVYLSMVAPDGRVAYLTEGALRARHRAYTKNGSNGALDAHPIERSFKQADARPLVPNERTEIVFDLLPLAVKIPAGHRIRISIAGADANHFAPPPDGNKELRVVLGASTLDLPRA